MIFIENPDAPQHVSLTVDEVGTCQLSRYLLLFFWGTEGCTLLNCRTEQGADVSGLKSDQHDLFL